MIDFSDIPDETEETMKSEAKLAQLVDEEKMEPVSPINFFSLDELVHSLGELAHAATEKEEKATSPKQEPPTPTRKALASAKNTYKAATVFAERIVHNKKKLTPTNIDQIRHLIEDLIVYVENGDTRLFERIFEHLPGTVDTLSINLVNVCALSIDVGITMGYDRSELMDLGVAAFLHDVGMGNYYELVAQARCLDPEEKTVVQNHARNGSETLRAIQGSLQESVLRVVREEHERSDGSGYPRGLENEAISKHARIIGMVDVYEALTHERPHRKKCSPLESIKIMVENKNLFDLKLMKVFFEKIGFYPKGTFVQLNTKEVAYVLKQNLNMPLSPVVEVIYDEQGKKVEGGREIDLSNGTKNFITRSL